MDHEQKEGDCPVTLEFMRHIFGEQYELGLDYVQLLYQRSQQILPVLCLVSIENSTGKSTFIKWLKAIFSNNCAIINKAEFFNIFNENWATKRIISFDEISIERKFFEKIKAFSTEDKIFIHKRFCRPFEVDFFGKFVLTSSNEDFLISASKKDIRYWVRKIPVPVDHKMNMLDEMIEEIPCFLHFLNRREIALQRRTHFIYNYRN